MSERKGEKLRKLAGHKSARRVAEELGIAVNRLYEYESQGSSKLTFHDAIMLASHYGCKLGDLIDDDEFPYTIDDAQAAGSKPTSLGESILLTYYRFATPFMRFSILRSAVYAVTHPEHIHKDLDSEEAHLKEKLELLEDGEFKDIPNAAEIINELIEDLKKEREAAEKQDEAPGNAPIPPILRRRSPRRRTPKK